ncbi:MAG: hypothetical protein M3O46_15820, partial [Myxococcota bacterium]|nr:hypothetical protein [Myxococcota bacterium]
MPPEPARIESAYTARAGDFRSDERLVAQHVRLELLHSIAASFARRLKPRDIAAVIINEATVAIGAHRGGIWLLADDAKALELVQSIGFSDEEVRRDTRLAC